MPKSLRLSILIAVAALGMTAPLAAQTRSAVSADDLDAAVAEKPSAIRDAVAAFLATDRAQELADATRMTVTDLSAKVAGLDDASLNEFAEEAGIGEALAGGDGTIVITATTAIIILLIIILLSQ